MEENIHELEFIIHAYLLQGPMGFRGDLGPSGPVGKPGHPVSFNRI